MRRSWLSSLVSMIFWVSLIPYAQGEGVCQRLIQPIAHEVGVPVIILKAISSIESRNNPYALNHGGQSLAFTTPREAWAYVEEQLSQGDNNIDMGCMQINWKSHQSQIADPRQLLIPSINIRYAAKFLKKLYQEFGSWSQAVAAYHSRTKTKGQGYLIKVAQVLKKERMDALSTHDPHRRSCLNPRSLHLAVTGQTPWKDQKMRHLSLREKGAYFKTPFSL